MCPLVTYILSQKKENKCLILRLLTLTYNVDLQMSPRWVK